MTGHVNINGSWKEVDNVFARVNGAWKDVQAGHIKENGAWKQFYQKQTVFSAEYFVLGGGGSGAGFQAGITWGAGGSGGYVSQGTTTLTSDTSYAVTIGAGGAGVGNYANGAPGTASTFHTVTAAGGPPGTTGNSNGGYGLGNVNANITQWGGIGTAYNYFNYGGGGTWGNTTQNRPVDEGTRYGGGWAWEPGGVQITTQSATNINRGGGGYGSWVNNTTSNSGGNGVVVLKYPNTVSLNYSGGAAGTTLFADGYNYTKITASGSITFTDAVAPAAPRYWRYVEGSAILSHHPRVSRFDLIDNSGNSTRMITYTSDNCNDSGTYQPGTVFLDLGAGNGKWFNTVTSYSVYGGGGRASNFTVQYSYDNSSWNTAFTGVMANYNYPNPGNVGCGIYYGYLT